ncbi:MAG: GNAT family N-acetyltransferase [Chloroflexi bacterium]|nr:GNAT family N-acetyltransferase [Chloroflexota bacterium]
MDYQVRTARITDVDRMVAILDGSGALTTGPGAAADQLRQLVSLPQASVLVVESHRRIIGAGVLSLRPSAAAGANVGVVDALGSDEGSDAVGVADVLLAELLRSARNKGCRTVEAAPPTDPRLRPTWARHGFADAGPRMTCTITIT